MDYAANREWLANLCDNATGEPSSSDDGDDDDDDGPTLMGIDMPRRQFASWVNYYLTHMTSDGEAMTTGRTPNRTQAAPTNAWLTEETRSIGAIPEAHIVRVQPSSEITSAESARLA